MLDHQDGHHWTNKATGPEGLFNIIDLATPLPRYSIPVGFCTKCDVKVVTNISFSSYIVCRNHLINAPLGLTLECGWSVNKVVTRLSHGCYNLSPQ